MSILARSGGIRNEFTFTGGVAKNEAAVKALKRAGRGELRRADAQHRPGLDLHRRARRRRRSPGARSRSRSGKTAEALAERRSMSDMTRIGIDVGSARSRARCFGSRATSEWLAKRCERIRRRDPMELAQEGFDERARRRRPGARTTSTTSRPPAKARTSSSRTGHFYSMTTHARGGVFLDPDVARGASTSARCNGRAIYVDERGKVLALQDDQPVRLGLGAVPREHRALPRRRAWRRSARCRAAPPIPEKVQLASARCSPRPT